MSIYNLGSINIDHFYALEHLPAPGETLAAKAVQSGLGGKGANISVAAARSAAHVVHIGQVGQTEKWAHMRLMEYGVDTRHIQIVDAPQGHALIYVDAAGENAIVVFSGTNGTIAHENIARALSEAATGDIFVTQNETNGTIEAAKLAKRLGLRVAYIAAPFSVEAFVQIQPFLDLVIMNDVEAAQLQQALGQTPDALQIGRVLVTEGARGCRFWENGVENHCPALKVKTVDSTGAGDTFAGYVLAGLDRGMPLPQAVQKATKAAALMVTRRGTADVIPDLEELERWQI